MLILLDMVCYAWTRPWLHLAMFQHDNGYVHFGLHSTAFKRSISVHSVFAYCAIIINQCYIIDFSNSAFKAQISNFQMFDKVNVDLYKRCLLLYFMLKKQELKQEKKSTGFAWTFWMFDSRRLLLLKVVQMRWVM